jgi:hypothetical protein
MTKINHVKEALLSLMEKRRQQVTCYWQYEFATLAAKDASAEALNSCPASPVQHPEASKSKHRQVCVPST